ncbi:MAG: ankyrin repeat domain-containing protein [Candidatus Xenobia bacterium]
MPFDALADEFLGWLVELPERAEALLKQHPELKEARSPIGESPLHYLVVEDRPVGVSMLLRHDADVNSINIFGETPLHNAVSLGYVEMARLLLRFRARTDVEDENGHTPLHLVAGTGDNPALARLLVEKGANVNCRNGFGTPLDEALRYNEVEMIRALLELGADVTCANSDGWFPLAVAVEYGQPREVLEMLLAHGADPQASNQGETAINVARRYQRYEVADWLASLRTPASV